MNHKYSTLALITLLMFILIGSVVALLESEDLDEICNTNNAILKRTNGNWNCSITHYAQGWYHNTSGNTITISSTGTYYNITGFLIDNYHGVTTLGNSIMITKAGNYRLIGTASFRGGNTGQYEWELFINDIETPACAFHRSTSSTAIGDATMSCIIPLQINDTLNIRVEDQQAPAQNIIIEAFNFNIMEIQ